MTTSVLDRPGTIIGASVGGAVLFVVGFVALVNWSLGPRPVPSYNIGQMVQFKIDRNVTGMVIGRWCGEGWSQCRYELRTHALSAQTRVRLFGADGAIKLLPMATISVNEFEIEPAS
jgi:hypothetical protein